MQETLVNTGVYVSEYPEDSPIYSALLHPIRREILSLLAERRCTFTEILKNLGIKSSHLSYHLESLGELLSKNRDGSYELSQVGRLGYSMLELSMNRNENPDPVNITKYWLPSKLFPQFPLSHIPWPSPRVSFSLRGIPRMRSIAVDQDDVWFYMRLFRFMIGQLQLKKSTATVHIYVVGLPYTGFDVDEYRKQIGPSIEGQEKRQVPEPHKREWQHVSEGITAAHGYVWYGVRRGRYQRNENRGHSRTSGHMTSVTEYQALCKLHGSTHRVTRYLFPLESEVPLRTFHLKGDAQGRTLWGPANGNTGWIFDSQTHQLTAITIGGGTYEHKLASGDTRVNPVHVLRDVAVEPDGRRGWFMDSVSRLKERTSGLYRFTVAKEGLMKYPLPDLRPVSLDIAPDGKLWFTAVTHERARWPQNLFAQVRDLIHPSIRITSLHSLNPITNQLTTYRIPYTFDTPRGVLVDPTGDVWFTQRSLLHEGGCGVSKLQPQGNPESTTIVTPEEVTDWVLKRYTLSEVRGEKLIPQTFEVTPNQPGERNPHAPPTTIPSHPYKRTPDPTPCYLFNPIDPRLPEIAVDLAYDRKGRIWFTTRNGYIGVLTPIHDEERRGFGKVSEI